MVFKRPLPMERDADCATWSRSASVHNTTEPSERAMARLVAVESNVVT